MRVFKLAIIINLVFLFFSLFSCKVDNTDDSANQQRLEDLMATYDNAFKNYLASAHQALGKEIVTYSPLSDTVTIPKYMEIRGTYYDYGYVVGHIAQRYGHLPRRISAGQGDLNIKIINMYQKVYPQYLDIARGIGDVFNIPLNELDFAYLEYDFFINLWYNLLNYPSFRALATGGVTDAEVASIHCSMIAAKINGSVFVGRNFDDDHEKPSFVVYSEMEGTYRVMANACYIPYHWIMDGVNEKGLYMGTANLVQPAKYYWSDPYPAVPAICEHHLFRIALETCATCEEVIELYNSIRPLSRNGTDHLMVVDAQGHSAVIEFAMDRSVRIFRSDNYYQLMTNIAYQEGLDYMKTNCQRFATGFREAEKGINGFEDIKRITRLIQGTNYGFTSFYNLADRFMQLFRRNNFSTSYDFTCPHNRQ